MRISVQLYTLRSLTETDFMGACKQLANIGFGYVELAGFGGFAPGELRTKLSDIGLSVSGSHVGPDALDDIDKVICAHLELGCSDVIVPWFPDSMRVNEDDWKRTVSRMQDAAVRFNASGLRFGFHNHAFDFQPINDTNNWDYLFANAPDLFAEPDTHWVHCAGFDPSTVIRNLSERVPSVHFKGTLPDGEMTEVGSGVLNWPDIITACSAAKVEFAVIEHDNPSDAIESVRKSFDFLRDSLSCEAGEGI